eukprot:1711081-Amphidinium_carterae.1
MAWDFKLKLASRLLGDATAAAGIGSRRGAGKVRHIETSTLWLYTKEDHPSAAAGREQRGGPRDETPRL